jgi:hypothetical protein
MANKSIEKALEVLVFIPVCSILLVETQPEELSLTIVGNRGCIKGKASRVLAPRTQALSNTLASFMLGLLSLLKQFRHSKIYPAE